MQLLEGLENSGRVKPLSPPLRGVAPSTLIPAGRPAGAHQGFPIPRPNPNILWSGVLGRPAGGLCFHQVIEKEGVAVRRMVYILSFIGSNPWFQWVTSLPDQTARKTTRYRPSRRRPDRVLCRFPIIKTNFNPDFPLRERSPPACGQGPEFQPDRAKKEAAGCPVRDFLRVGRPGGPGKSPGLPASRA